VNFDPYADIVPDVNIDTSVPPDGIPDVNIDLDGDLIPDINIDTDGDNIPDINIDTDGDNIPDANVLYRLFGSDGFGVFTGSGDVQMRVDAPYSKFVELLLGDEVVAASNYAVTEGSTVITLKESYLETFVSDTYWFVAVFTDGVSERMKLVIDVDDSSIVAAGGSVSDSASSGMSLMLPVAILGLFCLLVERKRWLQRIL
jgi:hypothetical protein